MLLLSVLPPACLPGRYHVAWEGLQARWTRPLEQPKITGEPVSVWGMQVKSAFAIGSGLWLKATQLLALPFKPFIVEKHLKSGRWVNSNLNDVLPLGDKLYRWILVILAGPLVVIGAEEKPRGMIRATNRERGDSPAHCQWSSSLQLIRTHDTTVTSSQRLREPTKMEGNKICLWPSEVRFLEQDVLLQKRRGNAGCTSVPPKKPLTALGCCFWKSSAKLWLLQRRSDCRSS